jgi:hypothetical protein
MPVMQEHHKYGTLCNRVFTLSRGIAAVGTILSDGRLVYKTHDYFESPEERERLLQMLKQAKIMVAEPSQNEDYFGKVSYVMVHHEVYDVFLFRISIDPLIILGVVVASDEYDYKQLVDAIQLELMLPLI